MPRRKREWLACSPSDYGVSFSRKVDAICNHLKFYGLEQVECLVAPDTNIEAIDFKDLNVIQASWVPLDAVVVVPVDRGFVGTLGTLGQHKALALIHNASRGVGIAHR